MRTIWKFPIELTDTQTIELPKGFKILSLQRQKEKFVMWAEIDPLESETIPVQVNCYGTGQFIETDELGTYIATSTNHLFVWHFYVKY